MLYPILWGVAFGTMEVNWITALLLMIPAIGLRVAYQILVPKGILSGEPSAYQRYAAQRARARNPRWASWVEFAVIEIGTDTPIAWIAFGLFRIFT